MTRINLGIDPKILSDRHLLAEHREIKRIPNTLHKSNLNNLPREFNMGQGHVRFFYDKGLYTFNRYQSILQECRRRGFDVEDYSKNWKVYKSNTELYKDYKPTESDLLKIQQRLIEKNKTYYESIFKRTNK